MRCKTSTCGAGTKLCADGRCQSQCLTEISCSPGYIKSGGIGLLCLKTQLLAARVTSLAFQLSQLTCPDNMVTCLTGVCRQSIYDCPQISTCPSSQPIQCLDGQCVGSKTSCTDSDLASSQASQNCFVSGLLLCLSDMKTCVSNLDKCPTMSTCHPGQIKCSENFCVVAGQQCPLIAACNSTSPLFCRGSQKCVSSYTICALSQCPYDAPVLCSNDLTCKRTVFLCANAISTAIVPVATNLTCPVFKCLDGTCKNDFCPEWLTCNPNQVQCANGLCVSNSALCSLTTNGCPSITPVFCPYQTKCVTNSSLCNSNAKSLLHSKCNSLFPTQALACPLGNCVANQTACGTYTSKCADYLFPNSIKYSTTSLNVTKCYVPACPPQQPIKCQNGLCVTDQKFCPSLPFAMQEIQNCQNQSLLFSLNIPVPCGDGTCRTSSDQCLPLYSCSLNIALNETVRCGDGSCVASSDQCPQLGNKCPTILPYMCQSGQCAVNSSRCFRNDNGCPFSSPNLCEYNGACYQNTNSCYSTSSLIKKLNLSAVSSNNICTSQGQVACFSEDLIYCATSLAQCFQVSNGCPVSAPIKCNGQCMNTVASCITLASTAILVSVSNIYNQNGCPQATPFRCQRLSYTACQKLPYSSFWQHYSSTCSVQNPKLTTGWAINSCVSQLQPYSCADGTCVDQPGNCKTCPYFCQSTMTCTPSATECTVDGQICPVGTPIRCIVSGQCVTSSYECTYGFGFDSNQIDLAFRGILFDHTCPTLTPIRCQNGACVNQYSFCLYTVDIAAQAMQSPVPWGFTAPKSGIICEVYCADGSCRDRQENCPLTQACITSAKPFRCNSGFCAANSIECQDIYGVALQNEPIGQPSALCINEMKVNQTFYRCEDGTCRPPFSGTNLQYQGACLQFLGCPLTKPFQCPTGQCVQVMTDCLQYSNPFCKGQYMCSNMACVGLPDQCFINYMLVPVTQIQADLNPFQDNSVDFAFIYDSSIGRLVLPSGSIPVQFAPSMQASDLVQYITVLPVPSSFLSTLVNPISPDAISYTEAFYPLSAQSPRSLSVETSLLFPMINITNLNSTNQTLQNGAMIEFKINRATSMDLKSDVCLATINNKQQLTCVSRNIIVVDSWVRIPLASTGVYAVIFNPDMTLKSGQTIVPPQPTGSPTENIDNNTLPTPVPPSDPTQACDTMWCKSKVKIIVGSVCGFIVLVAAIVLLVCFFKKPIVVVSDPEPSEPKSDLKKNKIQEPTTDDDIFKNDDDELISVKPETKKEKKLRAQKLEQEERETSQREDEEKIQRNKDRRVEQMVAEKDREIKDLLIKLRELEREKNEKTKKTADVEKTNARMRAHYQKEVERIKIELEREARQIKQPRQINGSSDEDDRTYQSIPTQETANTFQKLKEVENKNYQSKDADKLSAQWHDLVNQYLPDADLLSENSRPLLVADQSQRALFQIPKINPKQSYGSEQKQVGKLEINSGQQKSNFGSTPSQKISNESMQQKPQVNGKKKNLGVEVDFTI